MKLVAEVKLNPTQAQAELLQQTLKVANQACDYVSDAAWDSQTFGKYSLQKLCYDDLKEKFKLTAQMAIRCLAKVAAAYELDKRAKRYFKEKGGIAYDDRILSWNIGLQRVSIWTVSGRQAIPFQVGPHALELLKTRQGESDLIFRKGNWFLLSTCNVAESEPIDPAGTLGIDLGIVNIATDSDGDRYSAGPIEKVRQKRNFQRRQLQRKGTKSAKRRLKSLSGKQAAFQKIVNHTISKAIVAKAHRTKREIRLEDLTGIRARVRVRGTEQRNRHSNWMFSQLRSFIEYKAALAGIPVRLVNPAYTSQRCPDCGHTTKANRPTQAVFECRQCGLFGNADHFAALNISVAEVIQPNVSIKRKLKKTIALRQGQSPLLEQWG